MTCMVSYSIDLVIDNFYVFSIKDICCSTRSRKGSQKTAQEQIQRIGAHHVPRIRCICTVPLLRLLVVLPRSGFYRRLGAAHHRSTCGRRHCCHARRPHPLCRASTAEFLVPPIQRRLHNLQQFLKKLIFCNQMIHTYLESGPEKPSKALLDWNYVQNRLPWGIVLLLGIHLIIYRVVSTLSRVVIYRASNQFNSWVFSPFEWIIYSQKIMNE